MPRIATAPAELLNAPFTPAMAAAHGVTPRMLQSGVWRRLMVGVYCHETLPETDATRVAALALVLPPGSVVAGLGAAWLHGLWRPPPGVALPLTHTREYTACKTRRPGIGSRRQVLGGEVEQVQGIPVTSLLRTTFDLMRGVPLAEAVTVADSVLAGGRVTGWQLAEFVEQHRRWPWVDRVRIALSLAHPASRSPGESRLRMAVVLAGLPEPWVNPSLYLGGVIRFPDLLMPGPRMVALEYDGAHHETSGQAHQDSLRENLLLTAARLPVLRYRRESLRGCPHQVVSDVEAATGARRRQSLRAADFAPPRSRRPW